MPILTKICPRCTALIALEVQHFHIKSEFSVHAFSICPACEEPSVQTLRKGTSNLLSTWFRGDAAKGNVDVVTRSGWRVVEEIPEEDGAVAPEGTPPEVARIYAQAKSSHSRGELDGAAMLYRKTLETALKVLAPDERGTLEKRIEAMTKTDGIPYAVAKWAHEIRSIGNDGAHDVVAPTRDDINACGEFVDAFLMYAFTMPAKIANRLTKPEEPQASS